MNVFLVICRRTLETTEGDFANKEDAERRCLAATLEAEVSDFVPPTQEDYEKSSASDKGLTYIEYVEFVKDLYNMYTDQIRAVQYFVHEMEVL